METNISDLTAQALYELLQDLGWDLSCSDQPADGKSALTEFLRYMKSSSISSSMNDQSIKNRTSTSVITSHKIQRENLTPEMQTALKKQIEKFNPQDRYTMDALSENEKASLQTCDEINSLKIELKKACAQKLFKQEDFFDLQTFLSSLSPDVRHVMTDYFNPDDLIIFLIQCGQFQRINRFWEACGKIVAKGANHLEYGLCLRKILDLYNSASPDNPAALIEPEPGSPYKSDSQLRIDSDGTQVAKVLLPGLQNPGGKLMRHALVMLKQ